MTTAPACYQVFSTPELLEAICHLLSASDLLTRLPLVNRTFQNTIASSPSLQERLFQHPAASGPSRPNPLIQHVPAAQRPRFIDQRDPRWRSAGARRQLWPAADEELVPPLRPSDSAARKAAFARPEAGWRRLLLVQPPVRELWVPADEDGELSRVETGGDWVRLGMLEDGAFATWQTFGISVTGRGELMAYRDVRRGSSGYSLPTALWAF